MAFVGVPWAVENGARLTAEVLRTLASVATSDAQGVALPGDLKVMATASPSRAVNVAAGGMVIRNAQSPGESYVGAARGVTAVSDFGTTSGARSDLIIARVVDPDFSPWQPSDVPDPVAGPYLQPHVLQGVAPGTTRADQVVTYSAMEIARVDWPTGSTNQTNVTGAMITDLRSLARPRSQRTVRGVNNDEVHTFYYPDNDWHLWPLSASFSLSIPRWATHLVYSVALGHIIPVYNGSATTGYLRLNVNDGAIVGDSVQWEVDEGNSTNPFHILNANEYPIPPSLRGTTVPVRMEGRRIQGTSNMRWHPVSSAALDFTFEERVA